MLSSLDNYNKIKDKGRKIDRVADSIEAASNQRQSRGELRPIDQNKFKPSPEMVKEANEAKDLDKKNPTPQGADRKGARPPTNPGQ